MQRQSPVSIPGTLEASGDYIKNTSMSETNLKHEKFASNRSASIPGTIPVSLTHEISTAPPIDSVATATSTNNTSSSPSTSLIDSYSIRRRSMITQNESEANNQTQKSEMPQSDILFEELSTSEIIDRLNEMRNRLTGTMRNLPNQSPKKKQNCTVDKTKLLDVTRNLNGACKMMVQAACDGKAEKKAEIINEVIEFADKVTSLTEKLITKSDTIFEAEVASAKTDQMLKSLIDAIACLDQASESCENIGSQSMNTLIAKNTALNANISQLLESFYRRPS